MKKLELMRAINMIANKKKWLSQFSTDLAAITLSGEIVVYLHRLNKIFEFKRNAIKDEQIIEWLMEVFRCEFQHKIIENHEIIFSGYQLTTRNLEMIDTFTGIEYI